MLILLPDTRPGALQSIDEDRAQIVQQARSGWQRVCLVCLIEACRRWQLKQAWWVGLWVRERWWFLWHVYPWFYSLFFSTVGMQPFCSSQATMNPGLSRTWRPVLVRCRMSFPLPGCSFCPFLQVLPDTCIHLLVWIFLHDSSSRSSSSRTECLRKKLESLSVVVFWFTAPHIPAGGVEGVLFAADPLDACSPLTNQPQGSQPAPFALIARGSCNFDIKVKNAQDAGFAAAIVFNTDDGIDELVTSMSSLPVVFCSLHIVSCSSQLGRGWIVMRSLSRAQW